MADILTTDPKIKSAIDKATNIVKQDVNKLSDAIKEISFEKIGIPIADKLGIEIIPVGPQHIDKVLRRFAESMIGKETLDKLTEAEINEKIQEIIANIMFTALNLASIASANMIPSPPNLTVVKAYLDIIKQFSIIVEDIQNQQNEENEITVESIL